jgi:hypothetical protein
MSASLNELIALADNPTTSAERLTEIRHELSHRSTKKARELLARLAEGSSQTATDSPTPARPRKALLDGTRRPSESSGSEGPSAMPTETLERSDCSREVLEQLDVLRTTFSLESEILARWGVTETLPCEIRQMVLRHWGGIVTDEPDRLGRSTTRLASDIRRLDELAAARKEASSDA